MPLTVTAHMSIAVSNGLYFHNTSMKLELQDLLELPKGAHDSRKKPNLCVLTSIWQLVRTSQTTYQMCLGILHVWMWVNKLKQLS